MSTPPQEPASQTPHSPSPITPQGATQTVLSFLGHAASREAHADGSHTVPAVLGAAQNMFSRLASSSSHHASPLPQHHIHVPDVLREQLENVHLPTEVPYSTGEPPVQGPPIPSSSSQGSGKARPITPPEGVARITRSYPAIPEPTRPPRPKRASHGGVYRRTTGPYADSETAWHHEEKDPLREKCVSERIQPTEDSAQEEFDKATKQAILTGWAQNIALGLQIFIGALTTALGAALSGKKTSVAVSILGGASTLVASFLARTKSSNEPQTSRLRAQSLDHFLREIKAFQMDHGHEIGDKWDTRIHGFRLGLEKILGNHPESLTVHPDSVNNPNPNWLGLGGGGGGGVDPNSGPSGNEKYPMTTKPYMGV